jgi:hypothetical protein
MRWRLAGGEPEKPLVLYVGRLAREKGLLTLCEAAHLVPGLRFALVGDGPLRSLLERRFASVPSVFAGFLRGEPLAAAYAAADIFVFPSESETFGQVVLQAMASGVPPIVVRNTAPSEFVKDGESGLHVRPREPGMLAQSILALAENPDLCRSMALAARCEALQFLLAGVGNAARGTLAGQSLLGSANVTLTSRAVQRNLQGNNCEGIYASARSACTVSPRPRNKKRRTKTRASAGDSAPQQALWGARCCR